MLDRPGLDFSFSGLKTAAVVALRGADRSQQTRADLARGFESAVVDTLVQKSLRALKATGRARLVIAGGVGANRRLRERLRAEAAQLGVSVHYPRPEFCTDNAAMIALAGHARLREGQVSGLGFAARARWPLAELEPPKPTASGQPLNGAASQGSNDRRGARCRLRNSMTDRIFLRDLRTEAFIGIYDWEHKIKQTISIDVELPADIRRAARTDRIEDTLNYKTLAKAIIAFVDATHYELVETLAEEITQLILRQFNVDWVKLTLNKPGAIRGSRDVGVMIERTRADRRDAAATAPGS